MPEIGWVFQVVKPSGVTEDLHFSTTGSYSFDSTRSVTRAISGFMLVPPEAAKVNLVRDVVRCYLVTDGVRSAMGAFSFASDSIQVDALKLFSRDNAVGTGSGLPYSNPLNYSINQPYSDAARLAREGYVMADLLNVSLADTMSGLVRNDGTAETLRVGFDPSQEMQRILLNAGLKFSISGSLAASRNDVTWDGTATDLDKIDQLAVLAGHRNPWSDNNGVVRSVPTGVLQGDIIDLQDLKPTGASIVITDSYLTAPNRVIVNDNSSIDRGIMGSWDAPATAPHSFAQLGYHRTSIQSVQGLGSLEHANQVAASIGESLSARTLDCAIMPTADLDGPKVISFRGALWLVTSWSVNTSPNSTMTLTCQELLS